MYLQGMGEPLQNIDSVIKAADIMVHDQGLHFSPRKVTVSTSGLVPQLKRFLHESNCALAVSLNATTDEVHFIPLYLDLLEKCAHVIEHLCHNKLCRSETGSCRLIGSII